VIDTATGTKLGSIPVGQGGPTLNGGGIAASPDGSRVYVVNGVDRTVSLISALTNTVVGTIGLGQGVDEHRRQRGRLSSVRRAQFRQWRADGHPGDLHHVGRLSPDGTTAYVSHIGSGCGLTGVRLLPARVQRACTHGLRPERHGHVLRIHPDDGANVERHVGTRDLQPERDGDERLRHARGNGGADGGGAVTRHNAQRTRHKAQGTRQKENRRQKAKGKEAELQTRGRRQNPEPRTQNL